MTQIFIIIAVVITLYSVGCFLHYKNLLFFPKNYLEEIDKESNKLEIGVVREDGYYEGFHTSNLKYLEELQEVRKELLEKKIDHKGRKLLSSEHVHHIDGNPKNNNIDNLEIVTASEHVIIHKPALKNKTCSIIGCKNKNHAKNMCNKHYMRYLRNEKLKLIKLCQQN